MPQLQQVQRLAVAATHALLQLGKPLDRWTQRLDLWAQGLHAPLHAWLQLGGKIRRAITQSGRGIHVAAQRGIDRLLTQIGRQQGQQIGADLVHGLIGGIALPVMGAATDRDAPLELAGVGAQPAVEFGAGIGTQTHAIGLDPHALYHHVHPVLRQRAHPRRQRAQFAFEQRQPILIFRIQVYRHAVGTQRTMLQLDMMGNLGPTAALSVVTLVLTLPIAIFIYARD